MKIKRLMIVLISLIVLIVGVHSATGQGPVNTGQATAPLSQDGAQPQSDIQAAAAINSRISYQGVLKEGGSAVTGTRNMTFRLYSNDTCTIQAGSDIVKTGVQVTNGLFNTMLDVNPSYFNGQGLWLRVWVGGTQVVACQEILAVPYALSLRPGAQVVGEQINWNAIYASNTATTDYSYAVRGDSSSSLGRGLYGYAVSSSGSTFGVYGQVQSPDGIGVAGYQSGYDSSDRAGFWSSGGQFGGKNGVMAVSKESYGHGVVGWSKATTGSGAGVYGQSSSTSGRGVYGYATASSGTTYGVYGEAYSPNGYGVYGVTRQSGGKGVYGESTNAAGWAGYFTSSGGGVYISAPTGFWGLNVAGGTKSAVVRTQDGSRVLYTEESSEVWFTDYGLGTLENGQATIPIDPIFAQTVNLTETYHVFVQVYGNAEVYVSERTATHFVVNLREGDANVEFSYRIVAKRLGFEDKRLERIPEADQDPNLYPERAVQEQNDAPFREPVIPENKP